MRVITDSAAATREVGRALAQGVEPGAVVALSGDLGAGKTTFVQGFAEALGAVEPVASPTFVLLRAYRGRLPIYHFDVYRLEGAAQLDDVGAEECFWGDGVSLVEWADRIPEALPPDRLDVTLEHVDERTRAITFEARGQRHAGMLARMVTP